MRKRERIKCRIQNTGNEAETDIFAFIEMFYNTKTDMVNTTEGHWSATNAVLYEPVGSLVIANRLSRGICW